LPIATVPLPLSPPAPSSTTRTPQMTKIKAVDGAVADLVVSVGDHGSDDDSGSDDEGSSGSRGRAAPGAGAGSSSRRPAGTPSSPTQDESKFDQEDSD
jgi:hypothetical protein